MKYIKTFMIIFLSLFVMLNSMFTAYSMTNGFDVESLTTNESEKIIAGIPVKRINAETAKDSKHGQATKSAGRMPWHWEPMKDVISCDKLRGDANNL